MDIQNPNNAIVAREQLNTIFNTNAGSNKSSSRYQIFEDGAVTRSGTHIRMLNGQKASTTDAQNRASWDNLKALVSKAYSPEVSDSIFSSDKIKSRIDANKRLSDHDIRQIEGALLKETGALSRPSSIGQLCANKLANNPRFAANLAHANKSIKSKVVDFMLPTKGTAAHMAPGMIGEGVAVGNELAELANEAKEHAKEAAENALEHGQQASEHGSKLHENVSNQTKHASAGGQMFLPVAGIGLSTALEAAHMFNNVDKSVAFRNISQAATGVYNLAAPESENHPGLQALEKQKNEISQRKITNSQEAQAKKDDLAKVEKEISSLKYTLKTQPYRNPMVGTMLSSLSGQKDKQAERMAIAMTLSIAGSGVALASAGTTLPGMAAGYVGSHMAAHSAGQVALKTTAGVLTEHVALKVQEEVVDKAAEKLQEATTQDHEATKHVNVGLVNHQGQSLYANVKEDADYYRVVCRTLASCNRGAEDKGVRDLRRQLGDYSHTDYSDYKPGKTDDPNPKMDKAEKRVAKLLASGDSGALCGALSGALTHLSNPDFKIGDDERALITAGVVSDPHRIAPKLGNHLVSGPEVNWLKLMYMADGFKH